MRLKVGQAAADDLEGIWLYTVEHWSVEQADRYLGLITDGFDSIMKDPTTGRDCGELRKGYRRAKVGSHLIFYRLDDTAHAIEIIRVLHERMDIEGRLGA
ncbi:MAG: type II toxin-antitoxin system RelE/ParE family toxin [Flavobacteriales bacterium]|nr:type II toxin-antitoxin system RelE/ParE family toxin [Flavobacteriales bacterium]